MRALVVIDYQTDFVTGTLGSQDAVTIEDAVSSLISSYLDSGDSVFFTRDTHGPGYLDSREGRLLPVPHCIRGTSGWSIHGKVGSSRRIRGAVLSTSPHSAVRTSWNS